MRRIWARDASAWTGAGEARWLGWLDEPVRMRQQAPDLEPFAEEAADSFEHTVLLGMGGATLAAEVIRRAFAAESLHVLDSTHPAAIRALERQIDVGRTLFVAASKSGTTVETLALLAHFWEAVQEPAHFGVITDPGSPLEELARERGFRAVFHGEPTVGGGYAALSPFGVVPAALIGVDLDRLLGRAEEMRDACRTVDGPGAALGLQLGGAWREGRDKVCINPAADGFGLWAEHLLAGSTGKDGNGLVPAPGEQPHGPDRQEARVQLDDPYALAAELFRWQFAAAVAAGVLGVDPFASPNVQAAKERTAAILGSGEDPALEPDGSLDELLAAATPPDYVAVQAFVDPAREAELQPLVRRAVATGCVVTVGIGPRYLHSTAEMHKGGPDEIIAVQVVDESGDEIAIPGQDFGFARLLRAQAAGDYASLRERGRRACRVRLEEVS